MKRSASQSRSEDVMATPSRNKKFRLFNDPVHGHIELNEACQLIVDTKEFQRLRNIKQLGFVDFVFPGATHTRFEHALGTYHLAGKFLRSLKEYPTEVPMKKETRKEGVNDHEDESSHISEKDILCVEIAGLCHDLGCGPLSTFFSKRFLVANENDNENVKKWLRSRNVLMFEHMLKMNCLEEKLKQFGLKEEENDITFIKELIGGYECNGSTAWPYKGRNEKNAFLYEIVSNHRNGVDVCKFDYMARDCHNLGIVNNFDAQRYMEFARIIEVDGEIQICTRKKELGNLYNMFFTRYNLHKFAYQHPVVCGIELMIVDVFQAIKNELRFIRAETIDFSRIEQEAETFIRKKNKIIIHTMNQLQQDDLNLIKNLQSILDNFKESLKKEKDKIVDVFQAIKNELRFIRAETIDFCRTEQEAKTFMGKKNKIFKDIMDKPQENDLNLENKTEQEAETFMGKKNEIFKDIMDKPQEDDLNLENNLQSILDNFKESLQKEKDKLESLFVTINSVLEQYKPEETFQSKITSILKKMKERKKSLNLTLNKKKRRRYSRHNYQHIAWKQINGRSRINEAIKTMKEDLKKADDCISDLQKIQDSVIEKNFETCTWLTINEILKFTDNKDVALRAFTHLTDDVLFSIRNFKPDQEKLVQINKSVRLIERLYSRDIYKFLEESSPMSKKLLEKRIKIRWTVLKPEETEAKEDVAKLECIFLQCIKNKGIEITNLKDKILKVIITNLDFGMKDENPIHRLRVYEKGNLHQGFKLEQDQTSLLLQSMNYNEVLVRVYTTLPNKDGRNETQIQSIKEACKKEMQEWMKIKED